MLNVKCDMLNGKITLHITHYTLHISLFTPYCLLLTAYCLLVVGCVSPAKKKVSLKRTVSYERVLKRYPEFLYLVGEGEAGLSEENYKDVAENRARANMVKNIKVKIQEVITTKLVEKGGSIASSAQIFARSIVDSVELKGTEIVYSAPHEDRRDAYHTKIYMAICIVSREDAARYLKEDIDKSYKSAGIHFNIAKEQKDVIEMLKEINKAKDFCAKADACGENYNIITGKQYPTLVSFDSITLFFDNISRNIKIEIFSKWLN